MKPRLLLGIFFSAWLASLVPAADAPRPGKTRAYFIAADELQWNYAPKGDQLAGMVPAVDANVWLRRGQGGALPIFRKAVFREYTDATFKTLKPRPPAWEHLGLLGPLLRAEVGDRFEITFKNNTLVATSLHPHGVFYDKANEGARYPDGSATNAAPDGNSVGPGRTFVYHWDVPERAGPGPSDPSSVVWLYHSHVDSMRDINAGLVGAIVVTRRGAARPDGSPTDVDREFVAFFNIFDEIMSHYSVANARMCTPGSVAFGDKDEAAPLVLTPGSSMFAGTADANRFFTINGYIYGNLPPLQMKVGEHVRWYLLGLGGESGLHTPHWHGNVVLYEGHRTDVLELLPASMKVADMTPDSPGTWLFHCHVEDHMMAGMSARYEVVK